MHMLSEIARLIHSYAHLAFDLKTVADQFNSWSITGCVRGVSTAEVGRIILTQAEDLQQESKRHRHIADSILSAAEAEGVPPETLDFEPGAAVALSSLYDLVHLLPHPKPVGITARTEMGGVNAAEILASVAEKVRFLGERSQAILDALHITNGTPTDSAEICNFLESLASYLYSETTGSEVTRM